MTGPEVVATDDVLRLEDVEVGFPVRSGAFGRRSVLRAVDGVSLTVRRGTTFGLVGESGCGKTTLVRSILGLQKVNSGRVLLDGEDLTALGTRQLRSRRPKMQVVFQDPYSSLNEDLTVGDIVAVFMAGAYGLSASPQAFLGQQPALEMGVNGGD